MRLVYYWLRGLRHCWVQIPGHLKEERKGLRKRNTMNNFRQKNYKIPFKWWFWWPFRGSSKPFGISRAIIATLTSEGWRRRWLLCLCCLRFPSNASNTRLQVMHMIKESTRWQPQKANVPAPIRGSTWPPSRSLCSSSSLLEARKLATMAALEKAWTGPRTNRPMRTAPLAGMGPFPLPNGRIGTGAGGKPSASGLAPFGSLAHDLQAPQREHPASPDPQPHDL